MKSRTELDHDFQLPDSKRNHIKEICVLLAFSFFCSLLLLIGVCHADKVDHFFSWVISSLFYGSGRERFVAVSFVVGIVSFVIVAYLKIKKIRI